MWILSEFAKFLKGVSDYGKKQIECGLAWCVLISTTARVITVLKICCGLTRLSLRVVHATLNHIRFVKFSYFIYASTADNVITNQVQVKVIP